MDDFNVAQPDPERQPRASGALRERIEREARNARTTLADLTVLENDPYRFDTPGWRRASEWFAEQVETLLDAQRRAGVRKDTVHNRGVHYAAAGVPKPNTGEPYVLTRDKDWAWLGEVSQAARWLGIVPSEVIIDERNTEPVIRPAPNGDPSPSVDLGLQVELPDASELQPQVWVPPYPLRQPYRLALYGEKSSLSPILGEVSERYSTDLLLPTGELSLTHCQWLAKAAAADGRPLILFTFSDADPSGFQMPISIARKMQGLRDRFYPTLEFEMHTVALLPADALEMGLPQSPLGAKEQRAQAWRAAFGIEQVEVDALAALRPADLMAMAIAAVAPFFDSTLAARASAARRQWLEGAQRAVDARLDLEMLERIREEAAERLAEMQETIERLNREMQTGMPADLQELLPEIEVPEATLPEGGARTPLISSAWSWLDQTRSLLGRKRYDNGG